MRDAPLPRNFIVTVAYIKMAGYDLLGEASLASGHPARAHRHYLAVLTCEGHRRAAMLVAGAELDRS